MKGEGWSHLEVQAHGDRCVAHGIGHAGEEVRGQVRDREQIGKGDGWMDK